MTACSEPVQNPLRTNLGPNGLNPSRVSVGFWPRAMQKANIEKAKAEGKKPPIMQSTMSARDDNLGMSLLYGPSWRAGCSCLIPATWIYEPCYVTGKNVWHRIGLDGWRSMCVVGTGVR